MKLWKNDKKKSLPFLAGSFHRFEGSPKFPFTMAINSYEEMGQTAANSLELQEFLLDDIVFTSVYATFYEQLLLSVHENPDIADQLIRSFQADQETRDQLVGSIAHAHSEYIYNGGKCAGCQHCQDHSDVDELIERWRDKDFEFFTTLYMGMQTIQFSMEQLIYEDVLTAPALMTPHLSVPEVLEYRQYIYSYVEEMMSKI
jgi:hypothetical protein